MSEQAAAAPREERWYPGRNGGRLRAGTGAPGPRRETTVVKKALIEALRDPRGGSGKEFFIRLKEGTSEDRRTFANVVTKLIPIEVQGDLGDALKVVINTIVAVQDGQPITAQVPAQGTCVIGKTLDVAPMPAPITVKTEEVEP